MSHLLKLDPAYVLERKITWMAYDIVKWEEEIDNMLKDEREGRQIIRINRIKIKKAKEKLRILTKRYKKAEARE